MRSVIRLSLIISGLVLLSTSAVVSGASHDEGLYEEPVIAWQCLTKEQTATMKASSLKLTHRGTELTPLLSDPVGDGGINSFGKPLTACFDHDGTGGILDYDCGIVTYDEHSGTDIAIRDFYDMDEGVPILSAAPGVVVFTQDGYYDRMTVLIPGAQANGCIVEHFDGSQAFYVHMKIYSLMVQLGDTVQAGDTLGMIGSSGYTNGPHLHFQVDADSTVDPFRGSCQSEPSLWVDQPTNTYDLPFAAVVGGVTGLQLTRGLSLERPPSIVHLEATGSDVMYVWIRYTSRQLDDTLTWRLYENGNLWYEISHTPSFPTTHSYMYLQKPMPAIYGDWVAEILHNNSVVFHQEFTYDITPNQAPTIPDTGITVDMNGSYTGELTGNDPDGNECFWYEAGSSPSHGQIGQDGARKRMFTYVPDSGFLGVDTVTFYAIDDDSLAGPEATYIFDVSGNCCQLRGDIDRSGGRDVADLTYLVDYLFGGGPEPNCMDEADLDASSGVDVADLTYLVDYLFRGGPAPAPCS